MIFQYKTFFSHSLISILNFIKPSKKEINKDFAFSIKNVSIIQILTFVAVAYYSFMWYDTFNEIHGKNVI